MPFLWLFSAPRWASIFLCAALAFGIGWWVGYSAAKAQHHQYIDSLNVRSDALIKQAEDRNRGFQQTLAMSARIIEETNENNTAKINQLADHNRALLADRLRRNSAHSNSCALPNATPTAGGGDDAEATGTGIFLAQSGAGIVDAQQYADQLTESLRSCRSYIQSLQENFK